jgi:hypothetical protein
MVIFSQKVTFFIKAKKKVNGFIYNVMFTLKKSLFFLLYKLKVTSFNSTFVFYMFQMSFLFDVEKQAIFKKKTNFILPLNFFFFFKIY